MESPDSESRLATEKEGESGAVKMDHRLSKSDSVQYEIELNAGGCGRLAWLAWVGKRQPKPARCRFWKSYM